MNLYTLIRDVENFPKEGILFKDITTLLQDGEGLAASIEQIAEKLEDVDFNQFEGRFTLTGLSSGSLYSLYYKQKN